MNETRDFELLADIARLLRKYGPEPFEHLAQKFREGLLREDLLSILDTSVTISRQSKVKLGKKQPQAKKKNGIADLFQRIEKDDPKKCNMLKQLHERLVAKTLLPTLKEIRHFAEDNGLKPIKAKSRDKAILPLLRDLSLFPIDRVSYMISNLQNYDSGGGRTLEGWTDVILGDRSKDIQ